MLKLARLYRLTIVIALGAWSALSAVFVATVASPDPTLATISTLAFLSAQLALGVSAVGLCQLLRGRAPVLAPIAAALLFLSALGHAAIAGATLMVPAMDADAMPWSLNLVAVSTMIGLVGGTTVLAIALFRAKLGVAWLGGVLIGWVIVEFSLSSLGVWAQLASGALMIVGFLGLAVVTARSELRDWATVVEWTSAEVGEPVVADAAR